MTNPVKSSPERPRLLVSRSNRHLTAQVLSADGTIIVGLRSSGEGKKTSVSHAFGLTFAKRCQAANLSKLVFDRRELTYTGRIAAFIEGLRAGGMLI